MLSRRNVLKWATASALAMGLRPFQRQRVASAASLPRPRFYIQLIPSGGMDAVYCADPRTVREVEPGIDVPYAAKDIITTKQTRIGPSFALLTPWVDRIAIVNGIRQNSANHHSGLVHTTCLRTSSMPGSPTLFDLLGARRDHGATGAVSMGLAYATAFSPKFLGAPSYARMGDHPTVFEHMDKLDADDLRVAARALWREAKLLGATEASSSNTAANLNESAALFEAWTKAPAFAAADWALPLEATMRAANDVQRALWMFEHGLTRCATISFGNFDAHLRNHFKQSRQIPYLAGLVSRLMAELDRRIVDGRPLSEQTVVIVGSEIGRFPRLNAAKGKDHQSQAPWLVIGPWFATGSTFGATDRQLVSVPVSLATGKSDKAGHKIALDDLGSTLLTLDGANPGLFGYAGQHLSFLMR